LVFVFEHTTNLFFGETTTNNLQTRVTTLWFACLYHQMLFSLWHISV